MSETIEGGLRWQPPVDTYSTLPMYAQEGDAYFCTDNDTSYVFTSGLWHVLFGPEDEENRLDKVIRIMSE